MIPMDKIAQLIPHKNMFTAGQITKLAEATIKSFYYKTNEETNWWVRWYIACKYWCVIVIKSIN